MPSLRSFASLLVLAALASACAAGDRSTDDTSEGALTESSVDVVFSPATGDATHTARIAKLIAQAKYSIDVAIYSFSDADITRELEAAVGRGVKVRIVYESAGSESRLADAAKAASKSGRLEAKGMDVRFVNKIMHHKFVIVDGPRDVPARASTALLASGSANWSASATKFDENTLFLANVPEIALKLQREFDTMWSHSRDFALAAPTAAELSTAPTDDASIPDDPDMNAHFTSTNFKVKGTTFSSTGTNAVADVLVAAIQGAQHSIHVASGHLRSRPVAQALMAKAQATPGIDIKVYLDGQEYLSSYAHQDQQAKLDDCLAAAGSSEAKKRTCVDKGFLYGYAVGQAGVSVRYKTYAYRWDNSYAKQMHDKFFVIDGKTLFTGSYNLSDNAEHDTFENVLEFRGAKHAALVQAYEQQFAAMWETGRDRLDALKQKIRTAATIPLVFDSMALTHQEVTDLKDLVRDNCAAVDSTAYKQNAPAHQSCPRSGAPVAPPTGEEAPPPADENDN